MTRQTVIAYWLIPSEPAHSFFQRMINDLARRCDWSQFELKPHLSLLYKNLLVAIRNELAASINVPLSEVTFDAIKAVRCVSPTESGADVEAWRVVAAASLSGDRA